MSKTLRQILVLLFIACFSSIIFGQSQKVNPVLISKFKIDADEFIGYDSFGYSYQIKNNVFSKIKGNEIFEYKNVSLGNITKVDIQNPLKIVLFYEDFNSVVLLDNQLNKMTEINFSQNTIPIVVNAIGMSTQNQLWIFNTLNQQIGLFDYLKNEYKTVSIPLTESIKYYQTDFNTFFWIDKKNNWFSCDIFGKISSLGTVPDFDKIEIISPQKYIFSKANALYLRENTNTISEIEILEKTFDKYYYKDQILSIFTAKEILNYKIVTR
ncbi:hypothetical protein [Flavobacterium johnsoniae]|uniref:Glutamine cyclotransferase n=1 Tax=Flavobacterium johnsoniae (strain ATCC 17061 / DSM 2064 / JCM 8514 / BCRC 14874 / CCUG 350202 / NBRC 14942 / NCIMB 11054 / UW101) TaxID=376686 RepID=A5FJV3_FLAJ1|nr:hypothetical protein [Flavobacterium johnsoniae]ABQ04515.1 hypothetical protein Fjoh_1483 [Flavobacterium johnsoniae UW101]OXE97839.1 hypothetical protein B0A63_17055 [Flavobacterium johnsoniae UW101]WQG83689.1 hypothetical protein SR927_11330 [Flavobacterium johnsoniae UW101]SHK24557.1 hypothetical protein SAMN05444146_0914 [Flavobacterium johnsoniae]